MDFNKWNLDKKDIISLIIVFIFSLLCTIKMTLFSMSGGILNPDSSLYLLSALKYANLDYFNVVYPQDLFYTPVISFLTSLFFRMGYVDKNAIIIVTSVFCVLSYIGLYILLKNRFNPLLSLTGVIIYGSLSIVIFNLSKGLIDIPVISISMWILIFAIVAIDKDSKYFLVVFPLLVIGFFTKYVAGFILPLILLYYLMKKNFIVNFDLLLSNSELFKKNFRDYITSNEFKYILLSLFFSLILVFVICKFLILDFGGQLSFFNQTVNSFSADSYSVHITNYFYLINFPGILFLKQKYGALFFMLLLGILVFALIFNIFKIITNLKYFKSRKKSFKTKNLSKKLCILFYLLIFIVFLSVVIYSNHMISNISFLIAITILFGILQKYNINTDILAIDLLFLSYFTITFIFLSLYFDKTYRYSLLFIPAVIYFIVWGLDSLDKNVLYLKQNKMPNINTKNYNLNKLIPIILIIIFLVSTTTFMYPLKIEETNNIYTDVKYMGFVNDLVDVCEYINKTDYNYHSKSFASYYHHSRTIRWYLRVNVTVVNEWDSNITDFNNTNYIILNENKQLKNYNEIYSKGDFHVYYRK